MVKLFKLYTASSKISLCFLILGLAMVFWLSMTSTNAQPPVTVMKANEANQYEELQFLAEKGIQYTLQNSQDLSNWNNDITFIGNGELVKLRLFSLNTVVQPQDGNDAPYTVVSGSIRKVSSGGTYVSWVSLEDESIKRAFFPTVELDTNFPDSYTGLKNGYYLFLNLASPIFISDPFDDQDPPIILIDPDSPVTEQDLAFKNALPSLISGINSDTVAGASPLQPHRPASNLANQFWRINTDPDIDSDGDGIRDEDEIGNGTDPNNPDTDGDTLIDGNDADPLDAAVAWLRTSESSYTVTELELPAGFDLSIDNNFYKYIHTDLGESGHVLLSIIDESAFSNQSEPTGVPEKVVISQPYGSRLLKCGKT